MSIAPAYYTTSNEETEGQENVYHNKIPHGIRIKEKNKAYGIENRDLYKECPNVD